MRVFGGKDLDFRIAKETVADSPVQVDSSNMNDSEVQCPSCGEWFAISVVAPEDYGSQMDYDCEVC
ncbi:MAG: hypothetical protein HN570_02140 [Verrucomicrobia bacterium]|nr:hypothetical protein [Verrucomicrobiota bacterium]